MIMFDFNKKETINRRKLTEFSCLSMFLGSARLHTLGEKTYGIPCGAYHDETYHDCLCHITTFKRAMKNDFKEEFRGKTTMAIVKDVGEQIKSFKDENFREDFLPAVHLIKEEWAKFIADEFGEFLKEKEAHDDDNVRLQQEKGNQPQETY